MNKYIGQEIPLFNGEDLVTGRVVFSRDVTLPDMLYAKTLGSPYPHARVVKTDTKKALDLEGVAAVATAKDIKGNNSYGIRIPDQPVLVGEGNTVKMIGDPVALVAAETDEAALKATKAIRVEYELVEPVFDPEKACSEQSPLIHPKRFQGSYEFSRGELDKGFAESDLVIGNTFHSPRQEHAFLEPEACIAYIDLNGLLTIYGGLQDPHLVQACVARTLGLKEHRVRAIIPPLGGSFGGKQTPTIQIHAALLTMMTKRPVRMLWTREESLMFHHKRHPSRITCRIGLDQDGHIKAYSADALLDGGAYTHSSPGVIYWGGMHAAGPYKIPNLLITGKVVCTNNPVSGAFRGFGAPQFVTVIERILDIAARKLGIDPAEIRRRNALSQGDEPGVREVVLDTRVTLRDTIDKALEAAGPPLTPTVSNGNTKIRVGRGIACAMPLFDVSSRPVVDLMGTGAIVEMAHDGNIQIRIGVVEMGQGIATVLKQIVAGEFNMSMDRIDIVFGDSHLTPKSGATLASRSSYACGNAVKQAATKLKKRLAEKAAQILGEDSHEIRFMGDLIFAENRRHDAMTIGDLAERAFFEGVNLTGFAWFVSTHAGAGHTFQTQIADVEVDMETGEVSVTRLVTAHDSGRVLNPFGLRGQIHGGAIQMLGWALTEDMPTNKGKFIARSLGEYLIPTSLDIPESMPAIHLEEPYPTGPYGAKGVAEHSASTCAAAILNAIADATGVDILQWPATPALVWQKINEKKATQGQS